MQIMWLFTLFSHKKCEKQSEESDMVEFWNTARTYTSKELILEWKADADLNGAYIKPLYSPLGNISR